MKTADGYEVLDGQQRITSFGRYVNNTYPFSVNDSDGNPRYFGSLNEEDRRRITETKLTIYVCEGDSNEIQEWFEKINIVGVPLNRQELLNATYHVSFVTLARKTFSNSGNTNMNKWLTYIKGDPRRQEVLETALKWVSGGDVKDYMASHRYDDNIDELKKHFDSVIDWISSVFDYTEKEVRGLDWGRLYDEYHDKPYDKEAVSARVNELMSDLAVRNKKGIFEYILSGEKDASLLDVRVFDDSVKRSVYEKQTKEAETKGVSNCPLCAIGHEKTATKIWKLKEMDADHVSAWSNGGATDPSNCQMLCITHNRAKGNR